MTKYQGLFEVINLTGGIISEVIVTHTTETFGPETLYEDKMAVGQVVGPVTWESHAQTHDYWNVSFVPPHGPIVNLQNAKDVLGEEMQGKALRIELYDSHCQLRVPVGAEIPYPEASELAWEERIGGLLPKDR